MTHRCEQCGREGSREFKTLGGFWSWVANEQVWVPFVTVCANENACRKRWPRETEDAREARLG